MSTLAYERGPADVGAVARAGKILRELEEAARAGVIRDDGHLLARAYVRMEVLRRHVLRSLSARDKGDPGPEGSIDKLLRVGVEQDLCRLRLQMVGTAGLLGDHPTALADYLHSRAFSIYGGSVQIQRNIVAQRVLGMPQQ